MGSGIEYWRHLIRCCGPMAWEGETGDKQPSCIVWVTLRPNPPQVCSLLSAHCCSHSMLLLDSEMSTHTAARSSNGDPLTSKPHSVIRLLYLFVRLATTILSTLQEIVQLHKASSDKQTKMLEAQFDMTQRLLDAFDKMMCVQFYNSWGVTDCGFRAERTATSRDSKKDLPSS
jgi:hypothetical protein